MASTFTDNTGIEKIDDGQQSGLWGQTTNDNFDIVDRALNGVVPINLVSTSYTLTTAAGGLSEGQAAAVIFTGSLGSTGTITVSPNSAQKTYIISNQTNQDLIITQGDGGDVTVKAGTSTIVMCTGTGSSSAVLEAFPPGETANLPDTLVQRDGSGNFAAGTITANLTGNVTGNVTGNLTGNVTGNVTGNASTANAWSVARTLTVGVTGKSVNGSGNVSWSLSEIGAAPTSHTHAASDVISGVFSPARLASGSATTSTFLRGDSTWAELPSSGVLGVTASAPIASSGGANPNISLTGTVPVANGGTGGTTAAAARTNLGLGSMATENTADFVPSVRTVTINSGDGLNGGASQTLAGNRTWNLSVDSSVVRTTRTVTAGTGLTGGGNLSSNITINGTLLSQAQVENPSSTVVGMVSGQRLRQAVSTVSIGVGQTWQDVTSSRSTNTVFQNTTGRPIEVAIETTSGTFGRLQVSVTGTGSWITVGGLPSTGAGAACAIIPNNWYYRCTHSAITNWAELR